MKKIALFAVAILLAFTGVYAQKQTGYVIKSKITIEGTNDPNILAQSGIEETEYLWGNYTKSVASMQGMDQISITNGSAKTSYLILDITGMGKYVVDLTKDALEALKLIDYKYNYTGEKKTIAGYECEKVIVTLTNLEDDESEELTVYVSKDLNANPDVNFASMPGLIGYPLRSEVKAEANGESIIKITEAFEVTANKKIKEVDFLLPADGKNITMKELLKMFGGGDDDDED